MLLVKKPDSWTNYKDVIQVESGQKKESPGNHFDLREKGLMNSATLIEVTKHWVRALTEIGVLLVALSIVAAILFGDTLPFLGGSAGVVSRITDLISALGNEGVVGLVALGVILYIFNKKNEI